EALSGDFRTVSRRQGSRCGRAEGATMRKERSRLVRGHGPNGARPAVLAALLVLPVVGAALPMAGRGGGNGTGAKKGDAREKGAEEVQRELKRLSGTFEVIQFIADGAGTAPAEMKKMKVVQNGAEWKFIHGEEETTGKDVLRPGKTPKEIDNTYTNGPAKGTT